MIIWRGWGILALPVIALCVFGIGGLVAAATGGELNGVGAGIGLLVAAVATYFLGRALSGYTSKRAADRYAAARQAELQPHLENVAHQLTVRELQGLPQEELQVRWQQHHERHRQRLWTEAMNRLGVEQEAVRHQTRNQNSLFFIPVQWLWIPLVAGAAAAIIGSLASG